MLVTNGVLLHRFEELADAAYRLGRHAELDARSLAYTIEGLLERRLPTIKPVEHAPGIVVLDQGQLGSCTGNAGTAALAALKGSVDFAGVKFEGHALSSYDAEADEAFAVAVYHEASVLDGFPGAYPPDDTGSSGLAVCKAFKRAGLVGSYRHATSLQGLGALMQDTAAGSGTGIMLGMPWLEAFFTPDAHGFIDSASLWGPVAGGHEIYVSAIEAWDARDPAKCVLRIRNSWGASWGDHGEFRMRGSTYERLKSQGVDLKQLRAA